jgi:hypothetical protein
LLDPKVNGQYLQLKISRKNTQNVEISRAVETTILSGTPKTTVLSMFLEAKSGLVVLEEVTDSISLYYFSTIFGYTLTKAKSYSFLSG